MSLGVIVTVTGILDLIAGTLTIWTYRWVNHYNKRLEELGCPTNREIKPEENCYNLYVEKSKWNTWLIVSAIVLLIISLIFAILLFYYFFKKDIKIPKTIPLVNK